VIWNQGPGEILGSPKRWRPNSSFKSSNYKHPPTDFDSISKRLNIDIRWFEIKAPCNSKVSCTFGAPFPLLNLKFRICINRFSFIKQNRLNLDVWWFNSPAPVELRGPPCLGTQILPSNPQILNTHNDIFIQFEFILILDVWWFNNPALVEFRGPPCLGTRIPPSNPQILNTHRKVSSKLNLY
jgi:hypothetical protein